MATHNRKSIGASVLEGTPRCVSDEGWAWGWACVVRQGRGASVVERGNV